jgi:hypothetical protein
MRTDLRETTRSQAYTSNEDFVYGEASAQLTTTSDPKSDEVRGVYNYARAFVEKHANATASKTETKVQPNDNNDHDEAGIRAAQRALEIALTNSNNQATDFESVASAIIRGDGVWRVTHDNGEIFYHEIHPADYEVLHRDHVGRARRVSVNLGDVVEIWDRDTVTIGEQMFSNPYKLIPIVAWKNWPRVGSNWGDSNIEHIKAALRLTNERINTYMWLLRVQGNPPIIATGADTNNLTTAPGTIWQSTDPNATITTAKLLDKSTADMHLDSIRMMLNIAKELSNTPDVAFGIANTTLSGVALKLAYLPMTQAAAIRQTHLAAAMAQRNKIILRMTEVLQAKNFNSHYNTETTFAGVIPEDTAQERNLNRYDAQLALISRRTYLERQNIRNPDAELQRIYDETAAITNSATPDTTPA